MENLSDRPTTGTATYNVTPEIAGGYFDKLQCFCFSEQTLKAHERRDVAVRFFVDPELAKEKDAAELDTITLSYTFYPKSGSRASAAGQIVGKVP